MTRTQMPRRGFTLLEVIGVMMLLAIVTGLGIAILASVMRLQQTALRDVQRQTWRDGLADQFRADVASSSAAPAVGQFPVKDAKPVELNAGPAVLILSAHGKKQVIYRWADGRLERLEVVADQTTVRDMPLGAGCQKVEFVRGPGKGELISMKLTDTMAKSKQTRSSEIAAALGGDLR